MKRFVVYEWRQSDGGPGGPWLLVGPLEDPIAWMKKYPILRQRTEDMIIITTRSVAAFEPAELGESGGWVSWSPSGSPTEPLPTFPALPPHSNKSGG